MLRAKVVIIMPNARGHHEVHNFELLLAMLPLMWVLESGALRLRLWAWAEGVVPFFPNSESWCGSRVLFAVLNSAGSLYC